jgi:hypothetical protein
MLQSEVVNAPTLLVGISEGLHDTWRERIFMKWFQEGSVSQVQIDAKESCAAPYSMERQFFLPLTHH